MLLADLPVGLEHQGRALIDAAAEAQGYGHFLPVLTVACALTGAGILRGAGRNFWELGPDPGEEAEAPSEEERETSNRPVWLMLMPVVVLLAADLLLGLFPVCSSPADTSPVLWSGRPTGCSAPFSGFSTVSTTASSATMLRGCSLACWCLVARSLLAEP